MSLFQDGRIGQATKMFCIGSGLSARREKDRKETEVLAEDAVQERSDVREFEEPKKGKGVMNRRHDKRNKARGENKTRSKRKIRI